MLLRDPANNNKMQVTRAKIRRGGRLESPQCCRPHGATGNCSGEESSIPLMSEQ
jgi:hypothetical protein